MRLSNAASPPMDANDEDGPGSSSGCVLQMRPGGRALGDRAHVDIIQRMRAPCWALLTCVYVHLTTPEATRSHQLPAPLKPDRALYDLTPYAAGRLRGRGRWRGRRPTFILAEIARRSGSCCRPVAAARPL